MNSILHERNKPSRSQLPTAAERRIKVVSIDMGIRNISVCQFLWDVKADRRLHFPSTVTRELSASSLDPAVILQQERIDASLDAAPSVLSLLAADPGFSVPRLVSWDHLDVDSTYNELEELDWEPFSPAHISFLASKLVHDKILATNTKPQPSKKESLVVLIERQRFRSGGRSTVLEWTLRVNMLEMALYSHLSGVAGAHVYSMSSKRVMAYWKSQFPESSPPAKTKKTKSKDGEEVAKKAASTYKDTKQWKVNAAARVIEDAARVGEGKESADSASYCIPEIGLEAADTAGVAQRMNQVLRGSTDHAHLQAVFSSDDKPPGFHLESADKGSGKRAKKVKADDLADSFLQGLAWFGYQKSLDTVSRMSLEK